MTASYDVLYKRLVSHPEVMWELIDETRLPQAALDRDHLTSILFAIEQKGDFEQARLLMRKLAWTLKSCYKDTQPG